jgi:hypothetical protein
LSRNTTRRKVQTQRQRRALRRDVHDRPLRSGWPNPQKTLCDSMCRFAVVGQANSLLFLVQGVQEVSCRPSEPMAAIVRASAFRSVTAPLFGEHLGASGRHQRLLLRLWAPPFTRFRTDLLHRISHIRSMSAAMCVRHAFRTIDSLGRTWKLSPRLRLAPLTHAMRSRF